MITSVLVANRGEIARRIFRTCRSLGISCVAVYSDADAGSPHVSEADAAVRLPGSAPGETYLRSDLLVDAALRAGADAVHPGYGFLAESASFARAVVDAGLTWIGPPASAIASMGSKILAKQLMASAGVPVLPELDPLSVSSHDLPVLVKASAGGGGRGMRVVRRIAGLPVEVEAARSEAASAFGDGTVFCEPYLETGRHIEVQVLADAHGTIWTVGERECSIQRRHQKVIEETPSPFVDPGMRASLFEAARAAASAIEYVGAGTVEFLADSNGSFYFLEMNTRLQVEHPITECVTGLDLVALQIAIAAGSHLSPEPPAPHGHAIEARLYAEDPAHNWHPQTGPLHHFTIPLPTPPDPAEASEASAGLVYRREVPLGTSVDRVGTGFVDDGRAKPWVRVDAGVESGSIIGPHYDPMLAKVITWAPNRSDAARLLATTLARSRIHGLVTNRDLLVRTLRHPAFLAGETDTAFFDRHGLASLAAPLADTETVALSALAAALADAATNRETAPVLGRLPTGWRNLPSSPQQKRYTIISPSARPAPSPSETPPSAPFPSETPSAPSPSGDEGALAAGEVVVSYRFDRTGLRLDYVDVAPHHTDSGIQRQQPDVPDDHSPESGSQQTQSRQHDVQDERTAEGRGWVVVEVSGEGVVVEVDGVRRGFEVARYDGVVCVDSASGSVMLRPVPRFADPRAQTPAGSLLAPMPGTVVRVAVAEGERVTAGQPLLSLEAMKMEHTVAAPSDGVVAELAVVPGQQVDITTVLAVVKEES